MLHKLDLSKVTSNLYGRFALINSKTASISIDFLLLLAYTVCIKQLHAHVTLQG